MLRGLACSLVVAAALATAPVAAAIEVNRDYRPQTEYKVSVWLDLFGGSADGERHVVSVAGVGLLALVTLLTH